MSAINIRQNKILPKTLISLKKILKAADPYFYNYEITQIKKIIEHPFVSIQSLNSFTQKVKKKSENHYKLDIEDKHQILLILEECQITIKQLASMKNTYSYSLLVFLENSLTKKKK